jgi:general L-amino acid transport system substrate-binding protein
MRVTKSIMTFWAPFAVVFAAVISITVPAWARSETLQQIKKRGELICGVSKGLDGFSAPDESNVWRGFDVDFCKAVSAAIFEDGDKVKYVPLKAIQRFDALADGKVDLLSRNTTWTLSRDVIAGFEFVGVSYFDGQGFMTRVENGLSSAMQLDGEKVCVVTSTTSVDNAKAFFERRKLKVELMEFEKREHALAAYAKGECHAYTGDRSALASQRTKLEKPDDHMLLPEVISKEPLGPVLRQDDAEWADLVRWVLFLLLSADEAGWSSENADKKPDVASLAIPAEFAGKLGISENWALHVIKTVGNYGEIFERNLGQNSTLKLERGINALWTQGGILYAPPMR